MFGFVFAVVLTLAVVVDEFGATAGVISAEDAVEPLLGRETFEKDDVAVDTREFARLKSQRQSRPKRAGDKTPFPA